MTGSALTFAVTGRPSAGSWADFKWVQAGCSRPASGTCLFSGAALPQPQKSRSLVILGDSNGYRTALGVVRVLESMGVVCGDVAEGNKDIFGALGAQPTIKFGVEECAWCAPFRKSCIHAGSGSVVLFLEYLQMEFTMDDELTQGTRYECTAEKDSECRARVEIQPRKTCTIDDDTSRSCSTLPLGLDQAARTL